AALKYCAIAWTVVCPPALGTLVANSLCSSADAGKTMLQRIKRHIWQAASVRLQRRRSREQPQMPKKGAASGHNRGCPARSQIALRDIGSLAEPPMVSQGL